MKVQGQTARSYPFIHPFEQKLHWMRSHILNEMQIE